TARCNLVRCAHSFRVCLSEGSAVLLSRHGASPATRSESFDLGRSLTDWTICPCLDTPISRWFAASHAPQYARAIPLRLWAREANHLIGPNITVCRNGAFFQHFERSIVREPGDEMDFPVG